jgi:hypothetical protein
MAMTDFIRERFVPRGRLQQIAVYTTHLREESILQCNWLHYNATLRP